MRKGFFSARLGIQEAPTLFMDEFQNKFYVTCMPMFAYMIVNMIFLREFCMQVLSYQVREGVLLKKENLEKAVSNRL